MRVLLYHIHCLPVQREASYCRCLSSPLAVNVTISHTGSLLADTQTGTRIITVPTTGFLSFDIPTLDDDITDENSVVITINPGYGYTLGPLSSQTVSVPDNDVERQEQQDTPQDTPGPVLTFSGSETVTIEAGSQYVDAGVTCIDHAQKSIAPVVSGSVNTLVPDVYTISYTCTDDTGKKSSAVRTIIIQDTTPPSLDIQSVSAEATGVYTPVDIGFPVIRDVSGGPYVITHNATGVYKIVTSDVTTPFTVGSHTIQWRATDVSSNTGVTHQIVTITDTTPPTLTLNGESAISISVGDTYTDAGVTCIDGVDGTLAPVIQGSVNVSSAGQYTVQYMCHDDKGNAAPPVSRTISVDDLTPIIQTTPVHNTPSSIPTVSVAGDAVIEGNSLNFVISLNVPYAYAVEVLYITIDWEATAESDYTSINDFVIFEPGQTQHTISVETTTDNTPEGDERMYLELVLATNADISEGQWSAVGTISDPT